MKKITAALAAALILSSCASQGSSTDSTAAESSPDTTAATTSATTALTASSLTDEDEDPGEDIYSKNFPSAEQLHEKYPDKTVLVYTIEETGYERNYPFRTLEVNEYLDTLGLDYCICFYPIRADIEGGSYYSSVREMIESGEQVDIIYSSVTGMNEWGSDPYHRFISDGIFEPLDEYFGTDAGSKLYDIMPKEHWQAMTVDGSIYGVDGAMHTLSYDYGYFINAELAEKYGFDAAVPVEEQTDIIDKIANGEDCDVIVSYDSFGTVSELADIREITSAVYFDENEKTARCVLDLPEYIARLGFYRDMKQKGLLVDPDAPKADTFFMLRANSYGAAQYYKNVGAVDVGYNGNTVSAIPVFTGETSVRACGMATGISSMSENKEKAFEFLALMQTDPQLNDLLTYGIEGEDHQLKDGRVDTVINPVSLDRFANKMICSPCEFDTIKPDEYTLIYKNAHISDATGFVFDGSGLIKQISETSMLLRGFDPMSADDLDKAVDELRSQLEEKGLNEIIDACNKQYNINPSFSE